MAVFMSWAVGIVICTAGAVVSMVSSEVDVGLALVSFVALGLGMPIGNYVGKSIEKNTLKSIMQLVTFLG